MRPPGRAALAGWLAASAWACGTVWGFEDPILDREAGSGVRPNADGAQPNPADDGGLGGDDVDGSQGTKRGDSGLTAQDGGAPGCAACLPPPPAPPWLGPLELYEGAGPAPPCVAGPTVFDGYMASDAAPPATCSCSCGTAAGECSVPTAQFFMDNQCHMMGCSGDVPINGCTTEPSSNMCRMAGSVMVTPSAVVDAGCQPKPTVVPAPALTVARLCEAPIVTSPGCAAHDVCVPQARPAGFETAYCIATPTVTQCLMPPYTFPHPLAQYDDNRGCSTCSCGPPMGPQCNSATVSLYDDPGCSKKSQQMPMGGPCMQSTAVSASAPVFSASACTPSGGQPQGTLTLTTAWTVCCTQ